MKNLQMDFGVEVSLDYYREYERPRESKKSLVSILERMDWSEPPIFMKTHI
jgi:hypothetical protein